MPSPANAPVKQHECRQCCSFCDRMVHPSGCIQSGCSALYLYDDEVSGRRYMGCLHKVYKVEIDYELFRAAERTRHGYGAVKLTGLPLPQCRLSVERAYDGWGEAFECTNPDFFERPEAGAFDLRDQL